MVKLALEVSFPEAKAGAVPSAVRAWWDQPMTFLSAQKKLEHRQLTDGERTVEKLAHISSLNKIDLPTRSRTVLGQDRLPQGHGLLCDPKNRGEDRTCFPRMGCGKEKRNEENNPDGPK